MTRTTPPNKGSSGHHPLWVGFKQPQPQKRVPPPLTMEPVVNYPFPSDVRRLAGKLTSYTDRQQMLKVADELDQMRATQNELYLMNNIIKQLVKEQRLHKLIGFVCGILAFGILELIIAVIAK